MKLDVKSLLIIFLLIGFITFFSMWYFKGDTSKDENNRLKRDIENIQKERDSLSTSRILLEKDYSILNKDLVKSKEKLSKLDKELDKSSLELTDALDKLKISKHQLDAANKEIEIRMKTPILKTDGLLESLKEKLN